MFIATREHGDSTLYYQDDGQWTLDRSRALEFKTSDDAHMTSNFHQMYDVILEEV
jgi:hypothetical protein